MKHHEYLTTLCWKPQAVHAAKHLIAKMMMVLSFATGLGAFTLRDTAHMMTDNLATSLLTGTD